MNIIGKSKVWFTLSAIMLAVSLAGFGYNLMFRGSLMNFGIDFSGGTILTLRFDEKAQITSNFRQVRESLQKFKFKDSVIQTIGENDITIRTEPIESEKRTLVIQDLSAKFGNVELLEADTIGPVIGKELRTQAFWALLLASLGILIYVTFRFEFRYALAALLALLHDAFITIGIIAILWRSVDTPFIAAILTILGYSINDTIIIFDRIRENILHPKKTREPFEQTVNDSINQTMARSINTVLTVLFMNVCLLLFGGVTLKDFALTLLIGFTLGAYSSIFIASPILVYLENRVAGQKKRGS